PAVVGQVDVVVRDGESVGTLPGLLVRRLVRVHRRGVVAGGVRRARRARPAEVGGSSRDIDPRQVGGDVVVEPQLVIAGVGGGLVVVEREAVVEVVGQVVAAVGVGHGSS